MQTILYAILKMVVGILINKDVMNFVVDEVQFYMNDTTKTSEEKGIIVKENAIAKAKELEVQLSTSSANLLKEVAFGYLRSKL